MPKAYSDKTDWRDLEYKAWIRFRKTYMADQPDHIVRFASNAHKKAWAAGRRAEKKEANRER